MKNALAAIARERRRIDLPYGFRAMYKRERAAAKAQRAAAERT